MPVSRVIRTLIFLIAASATLVPAFGQYARNRYALILQDEPVAARYTSQNQLRTAAADGYRTQLASRQLAVRRELQRRNVPVISAVSEVLNAIFVSATEDRLAELAAIPGVIGVRPMRQMHLKLNKATQVMNAPAAWNLVGGQSKAGAGIKIGILDTGIDPNHPAFQDSTLTVPSGFPKCSGSPDACTYTNSKIIVARSYVSSIVTGNLSDPANPAKDSIPDDYSPRDRIGHGSAVASAAAGNVNSAGSVTFSGMAPKAWLGNYKIWGSPSVNEAPPEDVWITALNDAVADGMDVINMSSGGAALTGPLDTGAACGAAANVPCDPLAMAFENAAKTVVVVVAAGNDGSGGYTYPTFNSISSPATAPSVITVGATTSSHVMAPSVKVLGTSVPSNLTNIAALPSDSYFYPSAYGANTAPLVDAASAGDAFACNPLSPYSLIGAFALVQRGPTGANACTFDVKEQNVQDAGGVGMIMFMSGDSPALTPPFAIESVDQFIGPVVGLSNLDGVALKNYIAGNPGTRVTIDLAGMEMDTNTYSQLVKFSPPVVANQLATYSSFGPGADGAIKPEIVATGGLDIWLTPDPNDYAVYPYAGLYMASQKYDPLGFLYSDNGYAAADGTSFASPIVAGAAALVKQAHPRYTAAQIKSALVNTAAQDVTIDTFGSAVDVQWLGAGRLDAGLAANTNITVQVFDQPAVSNPPSTTTLNFGILKAGATLPITKQVVVTNSGTASVTLAIAVATGTAASGTTITADKATLTVAGGAQGTFNVALGGAVPGAGSYSGAVTLQASGVSLRVPYLFMVGTGTASNFIPLFGSPDGVVGQDAGIVAVKLTDSYGVPTAGSPVTFTVSPRGSLTLRSVAGAPACSPASSTTSVTCNTDAYGAAYADMLLGATPTNSVTVTVRAASTGFSNQFGGSIRQQPTISANGVVDAGSFKSPIAPGSYVSIYGTNLSDYSDSVTLAPYALPLSLDGVTVSFDVPSAKISVPGRLTYVSPGQVNVQVPWELQGQSSAQVKVTLWGNSPGNVVTVPVADTAPSFFENSGIAAARDKNNAIVTAANPVKRGEVVVLFVNGLGPVTNAPASGEFAAGSPLSHTTGTAKVTIGGTDARVDFSGLAPGFPGLYQVNAIVPAGITAGTVPVSLTINGATTKASTLPVN